MKTKWIVKKYGARIKDILNEIREVLVAANFKVTNVDFWDSDDYRWGIFVGDIDKEQGIDISFKLCESDQYAGTDEGINFGLEIVAYGGEIVGGYSPYNFTPQCWVPTSDKQAIEERFQLMESPDTDSILTSVFEFFQRKEWDLS